MTARNRFARRPTLTLSLTVAIGCVVLLFGAELGTRVLFPGWAPAVERVVFLRYDPVLGWAHRPGQHTRFVQKEFSVDIQINSLGMRDTEYARRRTAENRMLVIGDSFGWGFGVEHYERFSELLEAQHGDWEIMNASVNGYGTDQQLLYLQRVGLSLEPDVVLLLLHPNDFLNNASDEQYWYFKPRFVLEGDSLVLTNVPVPEAKWVQLIRRHLIGRTYLGEAVRKLRRSLQRDSDEVGVAESGSVQELILTSALLERMAELCRGAGVRFVVVSVPMPEPKVAVVDGAARRAGFDYLGLDSAFATADSRVTFELDRHWTAKGHSVAAMAIDTFLMSVGVLEP